MTYWTRAASALAFDMAPDTIRFAGPATSGDREGAVSCSRLPPALIDRQPSQHANGDDAEGLGVSTPFHGGAR